MENVNFLNESQSSWCD